MIKKLASSCDLKRDLPNANYHWAEKALSCVLGSCDSASKYSLGVQL